jgi:FkbM family methyltransferase
MDPQPKAAAPQGNGAAPFGRRELALLMIQRNLRTVRARIMGTGNALLDRLFARFGATFHKRPKMSVYGVRMKPNFRDRTFSYCLYGTYGWPLAAYLDDRDEDFVFVDIGANQGLYSLIAARNPHCRKIIALEPVETTFAFLADNVQLNGASDRSVLVKAALSDRSGIAEIALKARHSGAASLSDHASGADRATETIQLMHIGELDAVIPSGIGIVAKIDVEGHEDVVIAELLKSAHVAQLSSIFHEIDERWSDAEHIRSLLQEAGFTRFTKYGSGRHYDVLAER